MLGNFSREGNEWGIKLRKQEEKKCIAQVIAPLSSSVRMMVVSPLLDTATVALFWPATGSRKILFFNVFIHIPASKFKVADYII